VYVVLRIEVARKVWKFLVFRTGGKGDCLSIGGFCFGWSVREERNSSFGDYGRTEKVGVVQSHNILVGSKRRQFWLSDKLTVFI
jgi:hypothetical protein